MLKRAWLVICVLWSLFWGILALFESNPTILGNFVIISAPWVLGLMFFYIWRFIRWGRFTHS